MGTAKKGTGKAETFNFLQFEKESILMWEGGVQTAFERADRAPWVLKHLYRIEGADQQGTKAHLSTNDASVHTALRALSGIANLDQYNITQPGRCLYTFRDYGAFLSGMDVVVPTPPVNRKGAMKLLKSLRVRIVGIDLSDWTDHPHRKLVQGIRKKMKSEKP